MRRWVELVRNFSCEKTGAVAVEFALVSALYFIPLVVMIFQTFFAYHQANRLDRATQKLASDLRTGKIMLGGQSFTSLRDALCPIVDPVLTCSSIQVRLYAETSCDTNGGCWGPYYQDYAKAVRQVERFNARFPSTFGMAGDRQLLAVYYPLPMLSALWDTRSSETIAGITYHGIYSAAIWSNDPSVGVF